VNTPVESHYAGSGDLAALVRERLAAAGKDVARLSNEDLAAVSEFHIRGRKATLELAARMELSPASHVLDIGSGLGGPVAQVYGCRVTGVDLTRAYCEAATAIAATTIHVAMNIAAKDALYAAAQRLLKPGRIFAVYDVLQGEGGPVLFPVPWAREPSISHLATPAQMRELLAGAGLRIEDEIDSTEESAGWFRAKATGMAQPGPAPLGFGLFLGEDYPRMARNQVQNLAERRIRTVAYICRA
jgi:SAM-dependent methyltransferase